MGLWLPPHLLKVVLSISLGVTQDRDDPEVAWLLFLFVQ
jgi:hypothetical protein